MTEDMGGSGRPPSPPGRSHTPRGTRGAARPRDSFTGSEGAGPEGVAEALAPDILAFLQAEPRHFVEVLERFRHHEYRTLLLAWSRLREDRRLARDPIGRYVVA